MTEEPLVQRVEVSFVGVPPVRGVERAAGVSDVAVEGHVLRCVVTGSFQPFLEALHGHEVISLRSTTEGVRSWKESPQLRRIRRRGLQP